MISVHLAYAQQNEDLTPLSTARLLLRGMDRDSHSFEDAQIRIVRSYCQRQNFNAALEVANEIKLSQRVEALSYLASRTVEAHDTTATSKALKLALELLPNVDADDNSDFWRAPELVDISLENNDPELALRFVAKSERGSRKAKALFKVAEYFDKKADREKAKQYLDGALAEITWFDDDESDYLFELTTQAAGTYAKLGLNDRAAEFARRASGLVETKSGNKGELALMFARMGDYSQAVGIMESMDEKLGTMISLSSIYQSAGDERTALVLLTEARRIESSNKYSDSRDVKTLAEAYLKLDRADEALELLPLINDHYDLRNAATTIAEWFQARNRTSDARLALDIATKRAAQIISEKSQDIPGTASTSHALQKSHDLMALVESYLKIDDAASAEHAARAIDHPQYRALALALTASSFAKRGDSAKAEQLLTAALQLSEKAAEYSHDTSREYALYRIAQAAGQAGMNDLASKALEGFLQVLFKGEFYDFEPSTLFEMGLETEASGIPVSKVSRSLLKQIISKAQDDQ